MSLSTIQNFASGVTGLTTSLGDGFSASSGVGVATTVGAASAMSITTIQAVDCEVKVDLVYTSRVELAVYAGLQTVSDFSSDHYRVQTGITNGDLHHVKIIKRRSGAETTLWSLDLVRGKWATGNSIWIRKYLAGDRMVIMAYVNDLFLGHVVDATSPITGAGYGGVWMDTASTGMGIDNLMGGDLTVKWAVNSVKASPTQSTGVDNSGVNNGSFSQPWQTIRYAMNKTRISAGGLVVVRGGNYSERCHDELDAGCKWPAGTSLDNPVTLIAYPNESVVLTTGSASGAVNISENSNGMSAIMYLQFINIQQNGQGTAEQGFRVTGESTYIWAIGCRMTNNKNQGWVARQVAGQTAITNHHRALIGCEIDNQVDSHGL